MITFHAFVVKHITESPSEHKINNNGGHIEVIQPLFTITRTSDQRPIYLQLWPHTRENKWGQRGKKEIGIHR